MADFEKLYTLEEVEKIVRVTRQCLYNHIRDGKLKASKIGREYKVTESNLKQYIEKGTKKTTNSET